MKRTIVLTLIGLAVLAGTAGATPIGVGVFGGLSFPVLQDDVKSGSILGLRAPVSILPIVTVEPFYASSSLGDAKETLGGISYTRTGFDGKAYGLNAMLGNPNGSGLRFYPLVGIGKYKLTRTGSDDINEVGYNVGLGLGIGATPQISLQVRGELNLVKTGSTSRKFANTTVGLTYGLVP